MNLVKRGFAVLVLCAGTFAVVAPSANAAPAQPTGVCFVQHGFCWDF